MQCYQPAGDKGPVSIGQDAPEFALQDLQGKQVSLDQYKGQIVILDFWATWCAPCKISMPVLDEMKEQYSGKLTLLAVNQREPANIVKEYVLRENVNSRVLLDKDGLIGEKYGVVGIPMVVVIDQNGKVRYLMDKGIFPGWDSKMRSEINKLL
jgi:thiol-disulfide isomerase/thioredoxin